jgi:hypothetical protein
MKQGWCAFRPLLLGGWLQPRLLRFRRRGQHPGESGFAPDGGHGLARIRSNHGQRGAQKLGRIGGAEFHAVAPRKPLRHFFHFGIGVFELSKARVAFLQQIQQRWRSVLGRVVELHQRPGLAFFRRPELQLLRMLHARLPKVSVLLKLLKPVARLPDFRAVLRYVVRDN